MAQPISKYDPFALLSQSSNDLANFLGLRSLLVEDNSKIATGQWIPAVDIKERKAAFIIRADLPGINPEEVEVTMEHGVLTLKGQRQEEVKETEENYLRAERATGAFYRRFSLPSTADAENISAEFKRGVLYISIPKKEQAMPRKITIQTEEKTSKQLKK